jgi:hypothetical protein
VYFTCLRCDSAKFYIHDTMRVILEPIIYEINEPE